MLVARVKIKMVTVSNSNIQTIHLRLEGEPLRPRKERKKDREREEKKEELG